MIRADYCGNGRSWTANGTPINIYDRLNIQTDAATYPVDAEWTPTGARCINLARSFIVQDTKPTCYTALAGTCGNFANASTLTITEYKPSSSTSSSLASQSSFSNK